VHYRVITRTPSSFTFHHVTGQRTSGNDVSSTMHSFDVTQSNELCGQRILSSVVARHSGLIMLILCQYWCCLVSASSVIVSPVLLFSSISYKLWLCYVDVSDKLKKTHFLQFPGFVAYLLSVEFTTCLLICLKEFFCLCHVVIIILFFLPGILVGLRKSWWNRYEKTDRLRHLLSGV